MNIVFFITDNFPYKLNAPNIKAEYMALGFKACGCKVTIADSLVGQDDIEVVDGGFSEKDIQYYRFPRRMRHTLSPIRNFSNVTKVLRSAKEDEDNFAVITPEIVPYYYYLSHICHREGYKVVVQYHEYTTSFPVGGLLGYSYRMMDEVLGKPVDGILPISHFLMNHAAKFKKPQLILPIVADFSRKIAPYCGLNIFTFCGSSEYLLRYTLFIDAFVHVIKKYPDAILKLVVFGKESQIEAIQQLLCYKNIDQNATIYTQIPQETLYEMYDTSLGLLIPLDPDNLQDKARFSQKIAEYIGSKRPIITNAVGEIPYYFDKNSAVIVDYSVEGFAEGMEMLITDKERATLIGKAGYQVGVDNFNYIKNAQKMIRFLKTL